MADSKGIGLALSGGGFRATLFHLGVIRYLYDANKLLPAPEKEYAGVTHITSVSGGSVLAAHLVLNWEEYTGTPEQFDKVAAKLIKFIKRDVRGRILRKIPLLFPWYWITVLLRRVTRLREDTTKLWTRVSTTDLLARDYSKYLYNGRKLFHLKGQRGQKRRPKLYLLATDLNKPEQIAFTEKGIERKGAKILAYDSLRLGQAVAASSAFPGMFMPVSCRPPKWDEDKSFLLTDGGVYDNLGVKKFASLLDANKVNLSEIIVSDASPRWKTVRRGFFELITTPIRAADILFRRVYEADKKAAEQTDRETECKFRFLRLRDKVDPDEDQFALLDVYQDLLASVRTDLDVFSDLEIAALVRHGYAVARALLKYPVPETDQNGNSDRWNPLPHTKNKFAKALVRRTYHDDECDDMDSEQDYEDLSDKISILLDRSAVRRWRLFSIRDIASVVTSVACVGILAILLWPSISRLTYPPPPATTIRTESVFSSAVNYKNLIRERQIIQGDIHAFASNAQSMEDAQTRQVPLETWTTSQAVYALTKGGGLDENHVRSLVSAVESRFSEESKDWKPGVGGWITRPSEHHFQADPALWTLAAVGALLQRNDLDEVSRSSLKRRSNQIQQYLTKNNFFRWESDGLAFNILANQQLLDSHSAYTTSLALMAALEMRRAELEWNEENADTAIYGMIQWLAENYHDDFQGWNSIDADRPDSKDEAADLQILATILDAHLELEKPVPDDMRRRIEHHVNALGDKFPSDSEARVFLQTLGSDGKYRPDEAKVTFLWRPWAIRLCRKWYVSLPASAAEQKFRTQTILDRLTKTLSEAEENDRTDFTFRASEMLIGLS